MSSSSSLSTDSSSSNSSSSESSVWDVEWSSILYRPNPVMDKNSDEFTALVQIDLRYSDSYIVQRAGPLLVDIGGTFTDPDTGDEDVIPECDVRFIDDYRVCKNFTTAKNAKAWQDAVELRIRTSLTAIRDDFYAEHGGVFPFEIRRI